MYVPICGSIMVYDSLVYKKCMLDRHVILYCATVCLFTWFT